MKPIIVPTLLLFTISFTALAQGQSQKSSLTKTKYSQKDSSNWIENFREFRNAIYLKDKEKVKSFIDFPIVDDANEIWNVAYGFNEDQLRKMPQKAKPFTEQDFDKYFDKIFSNHFVKCLLKIKTDELYKKGTFRTIDFNDSASSSTYCIIATFDKTDSTISLNLYSETEYKGESGNDTEIGEFSIGYYLSIAKNGHIKFNKIRIAG